MQNPTYKNQHSARHTSFSSDGAHSGNNDNNSESNNNMKRQTSRENSTGTPNSQYNGNNSRTNNYDRSDSTSSYRGGRSYHHNNNNFHNNPRSHSGRGGYHGNYRRHYHGGRNYHNHQDHEAIQEKPYQKITPEQQQLIDQIQMKVNEILTYSGNDKCADCRCSITKETAFLVIHFGIVVCDACRSTHQDLRMKLITWKLKVKDIVKDWAINHFDNGLDPVDKDTFNSARDLYDYYKNLIDPDETIKIVSADVNIQNYKDWNGDSYYFLLMIRRGNDFINYSIYDRQFTGYPEMYKIRDSDNDELKEYMFDLKYLSNLAIYDHSLEQPAPKLTISSIFNNKIPNIVSEIRNIETMICRIFEHDASQNNNDNNYNEIPSNDIKINNLGQPGFVYNPSKYGLDFEIIHYNEENGKRQDIKCSLMINGSQLEIRMIKDQDLSELSPDFNFYKLIDLECVESVLLNNKRNPSYKDNKLLQIVYSDKNDSQNFKNLFLLYKNSSGQAPEIEANIFYWVNIILRCKKNILCNKYSRSLDSLAISKIINSYMVKECYCNIPPPLEEKSSEENIDPAADPYAQKLKLGLGKIEGENNNFSLSNNKDNEKLEKKEDPLDTNSLCNQLFSANLSKETRLKIKQRLVANKNKMIYLTLSETRLCIFDAIHDPSFEPDNGNVIMASDRLKEDALLQISFVGSSQILKDVYHHAGQNNSGDSSNKQNNDSSSRSNHSSGAVSEISSASRLNKIAEKYMSLIGSILNLDLTKLTNYDTWIKAISDVISNDRLSYLPEQIRRGFNRKPNFIILESLVENQSEQHTSNYEVTNNNVTCYNNKYAESSSNYAQNQFSNSGTSENYSHENLHNLNLHQNFEDIGAMNKINNNNATKEDDVIDEGLKSLTLNNNSSVITTSLSYSDSLKVNNINSQPFAVDNNNKQSTTNENSTAGHLSNSNNDPNNVPNQFSSTSSSSNQYNNNSSYNNENSTKTNNFNLENSSNLNANFPGQLDNKKINDEIKDNDQNEQSNNHHQEKITKTNENKKEEFCYPPIGPMGDIGKVHRGELDINAQTPFGMTNKDKMAAAQASHLSHDSRMDPRFSSQRAHYHDRYNKDPRNERNDSRDDHHRDHQNMPYRDREFYNKFDNRNENNNGSTNYYNNANKLERADSQREKFNPIYNKYNEVNRNPKKNHNSMTNENNFTNERETIDPTQNHNHIFTHKNYNSSDNYNNNNNSQIQNTNNSVNNDQQNNNNYNNRNNRLTSNNQNSMTKVSTVSPNQQIHESNTKLNEVNKESNSCYPPIPAHSHNQIRSDHLQQQRNLEQVNQQNNNKDMNNSNYLTMNNNNNYDSLNQLQTKPEMSNFTKIEPKNNRVYERPPSSNNNNNNNNRPDDARNPNNNINSFPDNPQNENNERKMRQNRISDQNQTNNVSNIEFSTHFGSSDRNYNNGSSINDVDEIEFKNKLSRLDYLISNTFDYVQENRLSDDLQFYWLEVFFYFLNHLFRTYK